MRETPARQPRAFFGRRKGHKLRAHQADLIERLLPRLSLDLANPPPADLRTLFISETRDVRLEIGFGGGEHLAAEAQGLAETGFIGCEPYVNGMAKILAQIDAQDIANIRLFAGDAAELLAWLPPRWIAMRSPRLSRMPPSAPPATIWASAMSGRSRV